MTIRRHAPAQALNLAALWVLLEVIGCASFRRAPGVLRSRLGMVLEDARIRRTSRRAASVPSAPSGNLLIVDRVCPDPTRDAGSERIVWIAHLAAAAGWTVGIASLFDMQIGSAPALADGRIVGGPPRPCDTGRLRCELGSADIVWLSRPQVAARLLPLARICRPGAAVVFDTVDVHHLRLWRQSELRRSARLRLMAILMRALERRLIRASDLTVVVTGDEQRLLEAFVPGAAVRIVPTIHVVPASPVPPLSDRRKTLLFVGGYSHPPNVDAVDVLVRRVMPAVWREDPSITLDVAGSGTPPARLAGVDRRVRLLGWLEDLASPLRESLALVAPIRFGAGMKGKIGLALAHGLPVVTTEVGAEGFGLVHGETGLIADTPEGVAAQCIQLAGDASLWARLSSNGQSLVRRTLSPEAVAPSLAALLKDLASSLPH